MIAFLFYHQYLSGLIFHTSLKFSHISRYRLLSFNLLTAFYFCCLISGVEIALVHINPPYTNFLPGVIISSFYFSVEKNCWLTIVS